MAAAPNERSPDILTVHAAATPDKPALIEDEPGRPVRTFTFAELEAWANQVAAALELAGVVAGDRVVWCGPNSADALAIVHGCRKAGVTSVPLNYRFTPEESGYVLDDCDARVVFVDAESAGMALAARALAPRVERVLAYRLGVSEAPPIGAENGDALVAAAPAETFLPAVGSGPAASMIYTSGTTGQPKGAVRPTVGGVRTTTVFVELIGYTPDDVYLTTGPLYHSGPGGFAQLAHGLGNTVVVQRKFDAEDWLRLVETYAVSTTFSAPTPIRMVCHLPAETKACYDRSSMRRMIANAAPWSMALKRAYLADFPPDSLWEIYGSTELGVDTVLAPADQLRKPGSCGKPAPGVEVKLLDDTGSEISAPGVPGELFVRSPLVFATYHKAHDKYEEDRRGEFHTVGDVAYWDEEGYLYICDRKKDMIISGGMNIYPAEIEAALEAHPAVLEAAVFGIPSEEWGEAVHAAVVLRDGLRGSSPDAAALIEHARAHLAGYKAPRSISFVAELPKTESGKLLKRVLREPYWAGRDVKV